MKAEYINPFIKASSEILKQTTQMEFQTGKPYLETSPFGGDDIVIVVGITGELRGQAALSMSSNTARAIASAMMMGMPVDTIDEMATSALSELSNMIMGNSATLLFNEGITVDITPPSLMIGENIKITTNDIQTIGVPLDSEKGTVLIDVAIAEKG